MKVLIQLDELIAGFSRPLLDDGHEVAWWEEGVGAFDIFDVVKPDLAILVHHKMDGATMKRMSEYEELPLIVATQHPSHISFQINSHTHTIPALVDTNVFYEGEEKDSLVSDLSMIGLPNVNVQRLLFPVNKYNVKIFGPQRWEHTVQYLGGVTVDEQRDVYKSATLCYADTPQEAVKIVACGGCAVSLESCVEDALGESFMAEDIEHLTHVFENADSSINTRKGEQEDVCLFLNYVDVYKKIKEWI